MFGSDTVSGFDLEGVSDTDGLCLGGAVVDVLDEFDNGLFDCASVVIADLFDVGDWG